MYDSDIQAEYAIQLNTCGIEGKNLTPYTMRRRKGRHDYYLIYIHKGYLKVKIDGEMKRIKERNCIIFLPNTYHEVYYPVGKDQELYYAHITGTAIEEAISMITQEEISVFPVRNSQVFSYLFLQLIEEFLKTKDFTVDTFKPISTLKISNLIFQLLDLINPQTGESKDSLILNSMMYINNHFCEEINIETLAKNCCLSLSRYTHIFKEKVGISPYKLILHLRIEKAKTLLENTSATIIEISNDVGFADPAYFSKAFKNKNGMSPSQYRNNLKKERND